MAVVHWIPRDPARDIAAEAARADRAPAVAIHVHPTMARRLHGALPVVVDATLPRFPGFEVWRAAPAHPSPASGGGLPETGREGGRDAQGEVLRGRHR